MLDVIGFRQLFLIFIKNVDFFSFNDISISRRTGGPTDRQALLTKSYVLDVQILTIKATGGLGEDFSAPTAYVNASPID